MNKNIPTVGQYLEGYKLYELMTIYNIELKNVLVGSKSEFEQGLK